MFHYIEKVLGKNIIEFQIKQNDDFLTFEEVIVLWKSSQDFRLFYTRILKEAPFDAFFWENKSVRNSNLQQTYEFVLVGTNAFKHKSPNPNPFQSYFSTDKNNKVVSFHNLGKNARLVVPCPSNSSNEVYTHLGAFVKNAPYAQINLFWQKIGLEMDRRMSEKALWLSTSGLGVYWLHARLDQRPKYYTHTPYKNL